MTALYVAEARAHARALVRVARLEATAALASSKGENAEENASREETIARAKEEAGPEEGAALEASPGEPDGGDPESPAASPAVENVASLAAAAEAEKRARDDDARVFRAAASRQATGHRDGRRQGGDQGGGGGGGGRCGGDRLRPTDHSRARGQRRQRPRRRPFPGSARAGSPLCRRCALRGSALFDRRERGARPNARPTDDAARMT